MKLHVDKIPNDIVQRYNLSTFTNNCNYVHFRITKGMYGLKQAAILAYEQLKKNVAPHGYKPIPNTVGLWKHSTKSIQFCLCVDDFGIKYTNKADAEHLIDTLNKYSR